MMIAYRPQSLNPDKPALMPDGYYWDKYEIEDGLVESFVAQGYTVISVESFNSDMSAIDLTAYNASIAPTAQQTVEAVVAAAKSFGEQLVAEFKTENVLMGITQAGKTVAVTKYLHWVEHHTLAGSLYASLEEIAVKQAEGIPSDLAPFVTDARLTTFKNKIQIYLGVPL